MTEKEIIKDGLWEYFDKEGNLTKSETWENEKLVE
jgi:antitoxin component YwqK of YwqJK toxin-antitoxin module